MITQVGQIVMDKVIDQKIETPIANKTKKYLLPCLKEYGGDFIGKLNNVYKIAVGIGDMIIRNRGIKHEKHIFILIDSSIASDFFTSFMEWVRDEYYYEDDYVYGNIQKSTYRMLILKFPEKFHNSFDQFKVGAYSKMYTREILTQYFEKHPDVIHVVVKDHKYRIQFTETLNEIFHMKGDFKLKSEEWDGELDFPPRDKKEIFNNHLTETHRVCGKCGLEVTISDYNKSHGNKCTLEPIDINQLT